MPSEGGGRSEGQGSGWGRDSDTSGCPRDVFPSDAEPAATRPPSAPGPSPSASRGPSGSCVWTVANDLSEGGGVAGAFRCSGRLLRFGASERFLPFKEEWTPPCLGGASGRRVHLGGAGSSGRCAVCGGCHRDFPGGPELSSAPGSLPVSLAGSPV